QRYLYGSLRWPPNRRFDFWFHPAPERPEVPKCAMGHGRDYFVLRSMAWSAVWHTQWKIGPISEASIGNVILHASPGFITLVDTPTLGVLTMIAEDAADRNLVMGLESRRNVAPRFTHACLSARRTKP